ncbi:cyclic nucleotide-binding domain-containing protein [Eleftheria terrae]|uniref:cyclic nucleotide-binding domain-containing protein n=1 Tax=Eleftheria terrae TaxID=1597781 RepID=UPI00263B928A|nr:cyclic nucleotide-binding domain-containing protein [Eleftheria terrae]WKB51213.1 cyclic nucleotide-binding domain-containing protein [Eleftheria terrae]
MNFDELVTAIHSLNTEDAFRARLDAQQWRTVSQYLTRHETRTGDQVIRQGDRDRTMYFLAQGSMQVYVSGGAPGASKVAILRPGAIFGEPSLFADAPRSANVEAMTPGLIWALRLPRFEELAVRVPVIALEVLRAAGAVMTVRMQAALTRQMPMS